MTIITPFTVSKFGININDNPTVEDFTHAVEIATDASNGSAWALGDLYEMSRQRDEYEQAFDATKKSLKTLQNYATVTRSFPKHRRRFNLSFSHYREVIVLKNEDGSPMEYVQDELLRQAVKNDLNRDEFRDLVKQTRGKETTKKTIEAQVGVIDTMLQKDYALPMGMTVKITFEVVELVEEKNDKLQAAS